MRCRSCTTSTSWPTPTSDRAAAAVQISRRTTWSARSRPRRVSTSRSSLDGRPARRRRRVGSAAGGRRSPSIGRPSARRMPSMTVSIALLAGVGRARCPPRGCGRRPARRTTVPSWSWFHQRRPSTWECAEGPTPHQCWLRQYNRLWRDRAAGAAGPVRQLVPLEARRRRAAASARRVAVGGLVTGRRRAARRERTRAASLVPGSIDSAYALTWSTPVAIAARTVAAQSSAPLAGGAVDQVQAHVVEPGVVRLGDRGQRPVGVVGAVQQRQHRGPRCSADRTRPG